MPKTAECLQLFYQGHVVCGPCFAIPGGKDASRTRQILGAYIGASEREITRRGAAEEGRKKTDERLVRFAATCGSRSSACPFYLFSDTTHDAVPWCKLKREKHCILLFSRKTKRNVLLILFIRRAKQFLQGVRLSEEEVICFWAFEACIGLFEVTYIYPKIQLHSQSNAGFEAHLSSGQKRPVLKPAESSRLPAYSTWRKLSPCLRV